MEFLTKKQYLGILILALLAIGLMVGLVLVQRQQTIKSRAQDNKSISYTTSTFSISSPRNGEKVSSISVVSAKVSTNQNAEKLKAVLKIDDSSAQNLNIKKIESNMVSISGAWDTKKFSNGKHEIEITLLDISKQKPETVTSSKIQIEVSN